MIFLFSYLLVGAIWSWFWYFKDVRKGAGNGEYLFWLVLTLVWPFPFFTEVLANLRSWNRDK
jgi:hypothetical protein